MDSSVNKFSSREVDWASGESAPSLEFILSQDSYVTFIFSSANETDRYFNIDGVNVLTFGYNSGAGNYICFFAGFVSKGATLKAPYKTPNSFKIFKLK